jgi:protein O-mannosyl-transferase
MTSRRVPWIVFALAVAIYLPTLPHFFVSDDFLNMERNAFRTIGEGLSLFSAENTDFYRPIPRLHFGLLLGMFSDRVVVWNSVGLLLHAFASVLAALLARDLLGRGRETAAGWAGVLFAIHFIHVEPVVWASGVTTTWVTLFVLAALLLHRRSRRTGRARDLAGAVACFAAAVQCKETAVAFVPLWLLTLWVWPGRDAKGRSFPRFPTVAEGAPFAVVLAAYLLVIAGIDRGGDASPYRPALGAHVLKNAAFFALGGFVPVRYWEVQELWAHSGGALPFLAALLPRVWLSLPLLAGAAGVGAAIARGGRDVRGALAWILAAAVPFLLLPGSGERFLYLPSFGACLAGGLLIQAAPGWFPPARRRAGGLAVAGLALLLCVGGNLDRQHDWILAGKWTHGIVSRWGYLKARPPEESIEFEGIPGSYRSAWVFRNGFDSMVRLYWQERAYWRAEEGPGRGEADLRMDVVLGERGTVGMEAGGLGLMGRGAAPDHTAPAPPGAAERPGGS